MFNDIHIETRLTFSTSLNGEEFMPLCRKTKKNTPMMYEVPNKETLKSEILPHLSVAKRGYASK